MAQLVWPMHSATVDCTDAHLMSFVCCPDEGVIADVQLQASPHRSQSAAMLLEDFNVVLWVIL